MNQGRGTKQRQYDKAAALHMDLADMASGVILEQVAELSVQDHHNLRSKLTAAEPPAEKGPWRCGSVTWAGGRCWGAEA